MQKFLVFAGTTEGRRTLELLAGPGRSLWASAATEYGGESLPALPGLHVLTGRLEENAVAELLASERFTCVFDATHPFAAAVTENLRAACERTKTRYVRVLRADFPQGDARDFVVVQSAEEAADFLRENACGNALLTTGSKELAAFTAVPGFAARLFVRVLPLPESLEKCRELGFPAKNIICMQGPFTAELNAATLRQLNARWLVTKETGAAGGFPEKCAGARLAGARLLVIGRPREESGILLSALATWLEAEFGPVNAPDPAALPAGHSVEFPGNIAAAESVKEPRSLKFLQAAEVLERARALAAASVPGPENAAPWFPLFISLAGKTAVVLGGGPVAARRALVLTGFGCRVRVIAPALCPALEAAAQSGAVVALRRCYTPGDCAGAVLAVAATSDRAANAAAARECAALGVPISVADRKEESTFYFPGIVRRGNVVAGVTASGADHALAKAATRRIREAIFGAENGEGSI